MEEEKLNAAEESNQQPENKLSNYEFYHVELTGKSQDATSSSYTKWLSEFAQKFSSFVDLAPVTLNSLTQLD